MERTLNYPTDLWYDLQESLSLLAESSVGRALGGLAHMLHFISRWNYLRSLREGDAGWYDMYEETVSWFHWSSLVELCLFAISVLASFYLFTRVRIYHIHHHKKPGETECHLVNSPHARFVGKRENLTTMEEPSPWSRAFSFSKHLLLTCWHFLLNQDQDNEEKISSMDGRSTVQELVVWHPKDAEKAFFIIYSPVHNLLWITWNFNNWLLIMTLMGLCSFQLNLLTTAYEYLIRDKAILSAEVMSEYDQKFVHPRLFPIRHDASTQTHEAEMVTHDLWSQNNRVGAHRLQVHNR